MNRIEAGMLLAYIARTDHRTWGEDDAASFADLLADVSLDDASIVARDHLREDNTWLTPAIIRQRVKTLRANRIQAANLVYEPLPDESVADFQRRLAALQEAAASGQLAPVRPSLALPRGGGQPAPPEVFQRVEAHRATQRNPALAIPCPWCQAGIGSWCRLPAGRGQRAARAGFCHPSRCEAVGTRFIPTVPRTEAAA